MHVMLLVAVWFRPAGNSILVFSATTNHLVTASGLEESAFQDWKRFLHPHWSLAEADSEVFLRQLPQVCMLPCESCIFVKVGCLMICTS